MAITRRGSIALRGDFSSRKGRARRVDLHSNFDFFRAREPPGCPPRRLFSRCERAGVRQPGGNLAARAPPWTRASRFLEQRKVPFLPLLSSLFHDFLFFLAHPFLLLFLFPPFLLLFLSSPFFLLFSFPFRSFCFSQNTRRQSVCPETQLPRNLSPKPCGAGLARAVFRICRLTNS